MQTCGLLSLHPDLCECKAFLPYAIDTCDCQREAHHSGAQVEQFVLEVLGLAVLVDARVFLVPFTRWVRVTLLRLVPTLPLLPYRHLRRDGRHCGRGALQRCRGSSSTEGKLLHKAGTKVFSMEVAVAVGVHITSPIRLRRGDSTIVHRRR